MSENHWLQKATDIDLGICHFINGKAVSCTTDRHQSPRQDCVSKLSARDSSELYRFVGANNTLVGKAVSGAVDAHRNGCWRALGVDKRKAVLRKLAGLILENRETLALYESLDVGKPISLAAKEDVQWACDIVLASAEGADKLLAPFGPDGNDFVCHIRRPVGVVAGIVGWNYPLVNAALKVGPALAMGNTLVLKPSEFSSLSAWHLAQLAYTAGVPAGVFNVVNGVGASVGDALARHQDIDLLTFTGSSATGKQLMISAGSSNMKRLLLECGGKSPYLVFDDCPDDLDAIAADIVARGFANQGELCIASSRVLIHDSIKERLLPKLLEHVAKLKPADPLDPQTRFGAMINEAHMNKVLSYIDSGVRQGAKLIYGGKRTNVDSGGYYVEPTVFDEVDPEYCIAREEIFGPVMSIFTFHDEEQAVNLANDCSFGLAAFVATQNIGRATRMAQTLNAGLVKIIGSATFTENDREISIEPHKQSGFGAEGGLAGLASYTTSTAVHVLA